MGKLDVRLTSWGSDRSSGSEALVSGALKIIRTACLDKSIENSEILEILAKMREIINTKFPELTPLSRLSERFSSASAENLRIELLALTKTLDREIACQITSLANLGANLIPPNSTVATISHSETVLHVLTSAKALTRDFHVIIGISEPGGEGRIMAKALAKADIEVTMVPDSALAYAIEHADIVVVGADSITADFFINKIGTLNMALAAKHFDIPFYALARLEKFRSSRSMPNSRSFAGPADLRPPKSWLITAKAPLFEKIPITLCTGIVTESGIIRPEHSRFDLPEVKDV